MSTQPTSEQLPAHASAPSDPSGIPPETDKPKQDQEQEYLHGLALHLLVLSLLLVVLIVALDISVVSTALPRITDTFSTIKDIGWYGAAFSFTNAALQPMAGKIYTFFPMKICFIVFVAIFELGSLLCAVSSSSAMFIIGRAVAGIGSSGLINGALSILALVGPPESRPMFMGLIMSIASAGQILGPLVGGALTQSVSWRWCFYINLPVGAVTIALLTFIRFPDNSSSRKKFVRKSIIRDFDIIGFLIFVPALIMFMMALQWGGSQYSWSSGTIIGLLAGFAVALFPLSWWEYRQGKDAMFPFDLLRIRVFYSACATGALAGGSLLVLSYYLPLWFQTVRLADPFRSAIDTLASFISQIVAAVLSGALCPRVIPYLTPFAIAGTVLSAAGLGALSSLEPHTAAAAWIGYQILSGVGRGLSTQIPVQVVQQHMKKNEMAIGTAVVSFFQFFGGCIFLALGQTTFSNLLKPALAKHAPGLDPEVVIESGATDVRGAVPAQFVEGVKLAYNDAVTKTFYLALGAAALAAFTSFGLGFKKVERKAKVTKENPEKAVEAVVK